MPAPKPTVNTSRLSSRFRFGFCCHQSAALVTTRSISRARRSSSEWPMCPSRPYLLTSRIDTYRNGFPYMKTFLASLSLLITGIASSAAAADYLVLDLVGADDPYYAAAQRLAELRDAEIVSVELQELA